LGSDVHGFVGQHLEDIGIDTQELYKAIFSREEDSPIPYFISIAYLLRTQEFHPLQTGGLILSLSIITATLGLLMLCGVHYCLNAIWKMRKELWTACVSFLFVAHFQELTTAIAVARWRR